jgi:transcriptional regulator with XRE-family HTH domain
VSAKRVNPVSGGPSPPDEPTELRRTLARNLRLFREAAGLSQYGLAKAAFCDRRLLVNIETNAANTTLDTITRLAKSLGVTEIDLLQPNLETVARRRLSRELREPTVKTEPSELRRRFARNLRARREGAGLLQTGLAKLAGMPLSRIGHIEVNAQNVTLDTITRLAQQLNCNEIDLLGPTDR